MKNYLRLLAYAKPIEKFAIPYFIFSVLSVIFGLLNFTLLIPLLNVLFKPEAENTMKAVTVLPSFSFSGSYFLDTFNYFFHYTIHHYGKMGALQFVCIVLLITVLLSNLFKYMSQRIMEEFRVHTLLNLRRDVFNKVMGLHVGFFSNERKGDIMAKVTGDVQVIQATITNSLQVVFREPLSLIGFLVTLFIMSFKLTFFSILVIPVSGWIISTLVKKLRSHASEAQHSFGIMLSYLDEALSGFKVIKAFNAVKYTEDKFDKENKKYTNLMRKMAKRQELASPVSEFMGVLVVAGIVLYGGSLVISNDASLDASTFIAYIAVFSQVMRPAKAMTNAISGLHSGLASAERVFELIDTKPAITDKPDAAKIENFRDKIEFKNLTFAYNKVDVLKDISFTIEKGKTVALVGPSGSGKSTISDLIPRFYDPQGGAILIDGMDLRDCQVESVRALMGIVGQESILFNDTIFNNIAFGKPDATEEEVIQAAKVANAHNFIMEMENGYYTPIGDRGMKLSGGQKQRISIARAVLKNPPILILVEATSALDTESEKLVQDALNKLMKNRTSLVIAHRLSTIQNADEILVIDGGRIVERGTHDNLLEINKGLYQKLKMMQSV